MKDINRHFTEEDTQGANKHKKRHSTSVLRIEWLFRGKPCAKTQSSVWGIRRWGIRRWLGLLQRTGILVRGAPESSLLPLLCKNAAEKWPSMNQEQAHTRYPICYSLILDFLVSRTVKNQFLLLINHTVCGFLLQQSKWTKIITYYENANQNHKSTLIRTAIQRDGQYRVLAKMWRNQNPHITGTTDPCKMANANDTSSLKESGKFFKH